MLGYTKRLEAGVGESDGQRMQGLENCIQTLQSRVLCSEEDVKKLRQQCEGLEAEAEVMVCTACRHIEERQHLDENVRDLESTCVELRAMLLMETTVSTAESTQRQEKVEALEAELARCRVDYNSLKQKM